MFGMSATEIGIILVLALLLLGPDELPKLAKTVGKALRELRKTTDDLKSTFEQEMVRFDEEAPGTPLLVPPPLDPDRAQARGALDQLRDPAASSAAAQTIVQPSDPGAARAAARLAAAGVQAGAQTGASTEPVSSAFWSESNGPASEASPFAAVAGPSSVDAPLASVAAPASTPRPDTAAAASAPASAHALADSTAAPRASAPSPRPPPSDTVPREKKPGPAA